MDNPFPPAKFAFEVLKEVFEQHNNKKNIDEGNLEKLHSVFGETLFLATELLENSKINCYELDDTSQRVFKIVTRHDQYTIYNNINFCSCQTFHHQVLDMQKSFTCKHVLAVQLALMTQRVQFEKITSSHMINFLNAQLEAIETTEIK